MEKFYFPMRNGRPVVLSVKGRQVLFLANDSEVFHNCQVLQPIDRLEIVEEIEDDADLLEAVALETGLEEKQIVVVPPDAAVDEVVEALRNELPWLH